MNREILQGDVIANLKTLPDNLVDVIISSPPYWNLRNYNIEGQIGLEPDFRDYLKTMQTIMDELKRVLKGTGTCWINLGDSYGTHRSGDDNKGNSTEEGRKLSQESVKNYDKSRMGIPERFYINCIDSGWIARNHIVWTKNNSMPSSVKDRFKNAWESVFFFSKNKKYYFDLDAVRVPTTTGNYKPFNIRVRDAKNGILDKKYGKQYKASEKEIENYDDDHITKKTRKKYGKGEKKWNYKTMANGLDGHSGNSANHPKGKNPGDVFQINTKPFPEAHFATFPPALPEKILKCACPPGGLVLDPFFGSGTVGLVAEQMGLRWCGIELNPEYIEIAKKRLAPFTSVEKLEAFV